MENAIDQTRIVNTVLADGDGVRLATNYGKGPRVRDINLFYVC